MDIIVKKRYDLNKYKIYIVINRGGCWMGLKISNQQVNGKDVSITTLFEEQAVNTPTDIAIRFQGKGYTYEEINKKSNQLARYLQHQGIGNETLVGICLERSQKMVIVLLGILKAGAAYVPLEPTHPIERNKWILQDAAIQHVIIEEKLAEYYRDDFIRLICIEDEKNEIEKECQDYLARNFEKDQLAYIIYTSGSTGKPKGVQVFQKSVVNLLNHMKEMLNVVKEDKLLAVTTITFDISVLELFLPLCTGACLVIAETQTALDGQKLNKLFESEAITIMQATPVTWYMLLEVHWQGNEKLRILCGGEPWTRKLADQLVDQCISLWNVYGPTETTIWSTMGRIIKGEGPLTIGQPITNTELYILDETMKEVSVGTIGELYIGGIGVAKGYLNNYELTREKFIPNPYSGHMGDRLYKTGDIVRLLENEEIEYVERVDFQVKIRGFRIELGEIENIAEQHEMIQKAVAVVANDQYENKQIRLFIRILNRGYVSEGDIRNHIKKALPPYMVPNLIQFVNEFPMTENGKINRKTLSEKSMLTSREGYHYASPQTPMEKDIAAIWTELLDVQDIGIYDNFLELGGHSLMANRLLIRLNHLFNTDLTLLEILTSDLNIASMVSMVEDKLMGNMNEEEIQSLLSEINDLTDDQIQELLKGTTI
ncbi:MAG: amino acid adenylation domain protein [Clostridia bacterium]|jgi:amino acid adenylation domain-containing protein|nr:amino acid adenylation domain protein [Clostridia bacterium]